MLSHNEKQKLATVLSELSKISVPENSPTVEVIRNLETKVAKSNTRAEDLSPDELSDLLTNLNQVLLKAEKLNFDNIEVFQILDHISPKS